MLGFCEDLTQRQKIVCYGTSGRGAEFQWTMLDFFGTLKSSVVNSFDDQTKLIRPEDLETPL